MRTRQNIDIVHYELDSTGKPVTIDYYPGAIEGKLSANQQNVYVSLPLHMQNRRRKMKSAAQFQHMP